MMMSMPVVWCADPNSNNTPTAFTLQGIQLQGNINEQHMLAVTELINAAAEGRLVLPSDGTIVLLNCGIGVGSMIIEKNKQKEQQQLMCADDIEKDALSKPMKLSCEILEEAILNKEYETLYEFLCCARCINKHPTKSSSSHSHQPSAQHIVKAIKRIPELVDIKQVKSSFRRRVVEGRKLKKNKRQSAIQRKKTRFFLLKRNLFYLIVKNNFKLKETTRLEKIKRTLNRKPNNYFNIKKMSNRFDFLAESNRKISVDSTISSHDSGFIDMMIKNKLNLNICLTQSRNRRKSYEEFKLQTKRDAIDDNSNQLKHNLLLKSRRKSYEEFKKNLIPPKKSSSDPISNLNDISENSSSTCTSSATINSETRSNYTKTPSIRSTSSSSNGSLSSPPSPSTSMRHKFYDRLNSYGTIYDIIHHKNQSVNTTNNMTYGTIYEILQKNRTTERKNSIIPVTPANTPTYDGNNNNQFFGTIYDIKQMTNQNMIVPPEIIVTPPPSPASLFSPSTIIQNDSQTNSINGTTLTTETDVVCSKTHRFQVKKITEDELNATKQQLLTVDAAVGKKQTRIRRFSNILSPKLLSEPLKDIKLLSADNLTKIQEDELYTRINKNGIEITTPIISHHNHQHTIPNNSEPLNYFQKSKLGKFNLSGRFKYHSSGSGGSDNLNSPKKNHLIKKNTRRLSEFTRGEFLNEKQ